MDPLEENAFFVLELPSDAASMEVERAGKKLLGMLELGLEQAQSYQTPYGPRPRTPEKVREAVRALLDPQKRLALEVWAHAPRRAEAPVTSSEPAPWSAARQAPWWSWRRVLSQGGGR